jgi:hypothetical protein
MSITGLPDLVGGLKTIAGCIAVETAIIVRGKEVIFAWFEDRQAVLRWYHSGMHQEILKSFFPEFKAQGPLRGVPSRLRHLRTGVDTQQLASASP